MTQNLRTLLLAASAAALIAACAEQNDAAATTSPAGGGDPALQETLADPAPEGDLALNVETLAEGLVNPWSIAFLPDGTMLVTERAGRLRVVRDGALVDAPVAGTPEAYVDGQAGYFDVLPHPDFEQNNVLFLAYAAGSENENALRIARGVFDGASFNDVEVIYEAKPLKRAGYHYGGRLVWGPDDKLYFSVGEGSRYKELAQDMSTSFGAIIRLNEDDSVPEDNPDFGEGSLPELYSKGHRNPQGFVYDAERDIFWAHEHGPRGGDEVNIIEPGNNYGWPLASYGIDYNGAKITPFTEYEGTAQPVKYWTPSIGPSGLAVYRGDMFEGWDGDLLVGSMALRALHRVIMDGNEPVGEERYLLDERIREVRVGPDGAIYVTTEDRGGEPVGQILRVTPQ